MRLNASNLVQRNQLHHIPTLSLVSYDSAMWGSGCVYTPYTHTYMNNKVVYLLTSFIYRIFHFHIIIILQMGLFDIIRPAVNKHEHEVSKLKKKIARLEVEVTRQGKTIESLTTTLDGCSSRFEYILSGGTTYKKQYFVKELTSKKN